MPVDVEDLLRRGGEVLIPFLHYCVFSVQLGPVFVYLARDYRNNPTAPRALALYDVFCAPDAPARVRAGAALPPYDLRLVAALRPVRERWLASRAPAPSEDEPAPAAPLPPPYLFES